jgi:tetratricopeptide (TPR) repeat protein
LNDSESGPASSYVAQAEALLDIGRDADAIPLLQRAIAADPEDATPRCLLGAALLGIDQPAEALQAAEGALALNADDEWPHRVRCMALLELGRKAEALSAAKEAVRLDAANPVGLFALFEAQLVSRSIAAPRETAQRLVALAPDWPPAHRALGAIAVRRRRWLEAEAHYRKALELDPTDTFTLNNLGVALDGQGRGKEAIEAFEMAAESDPSHKLARRNLYVSTRGYIGLGVALAVVFFVARSAAQLIDAAAGSAFATLLALAVMVAAGAVFLAVRSRSRRKDLSHTVTTHYDLEQARRRPFAVARLMIIAGIYILIVNSLFELLSQSAAYGIAVAVACSLGWYFIARPVWRRFVGPALRQLL